MIRRPGTVFSGPDDANGSTRDDLGSLDLEGGYLNSPGTARALFRSENSESGNSVPILGPANNLTNIIIGTPPEPLLLTCARASRLFPFSFGSDVLVFLQNLLHSVSSVFRKIRQTSLPPQF